MDEICECGEVMMLNYGQDLELDKWVCPCCRKTIEIDSNNLPVEAYFG